MKWAKGCIGEGFPSYSWRLVLREQLSRRSHNLAAELIETADLCLELHRERVDKAIVRGVRLAEAEEAP